MTNFDIYDLSGGQNEAVELAKKNKGKVLFASFLFISFIILFIVFVSLYSHEKNNNENLQDELNKCHVDLSTSKTELETHKADSKSCKADLAAVMPNNTNNPATFSNNEQFTNDLPYQLNNGSVSLAPDNDYNETLQKMSLDKAVFSQHAKHVKDGNKITATASFSPSRSDNQDIVTSWGLSRPTYVPIDPSARNVPSQDPEQGSKPVRLQWK
jgi:archaellum component FlaF (FlaF/FlaG flagellin family)